VFSNLVSSVRRAAAAGAREVTWRRQVIADAMDAAEARFVDAFVARGDAGIENLQAWARTVGANRARQLLRRRKVIVVDDFEAVVEATMAEKRGESPAGGARPAELEAMRLRIRELAVRHRGDLRGREFEVVMKLVERDGMTFHLAANELGMDRSNLKRCLRSAAKRLARLRK
jgi:DNA-directed RNA polymerase specialized sigma24 family protein